MTGTTDAPHSAAPEPAAGRHRRPRWMAIAGVVTPLLLIPGAIYLPGWLRMWSLLALVVYAGTAAALDRASQPVTTVRARRPVHLAGPEPARAPTSVPAPAPAPADPLSPHQRSTVLSYAAGITTRCAAPAAVLGTAAPLLAWAGAAGTREDQALRMEALRQQFMAVVSGRVSADAAAKAAASCFRDDPQAFVSAAAVLHSGMTGDVQRAVAEFMHSVNRFAGHGDIAGAVDLALGRHVNGEQVSAAISMLVRSGHLTRAGGTVVNPLYGWKTPAP